MIDAKTVARISRDIQRQFPEFQHVRPEVKEKALIPQRQLYAKLNLGMPKHPRRVYTLTFRKDVRTSDDVPLRRILIVTLDERGAIVKISQSR